MSGYERSGGRGRGHDGDGPTRDVRPAPGKVALTDRLQRRTPTRAMVETSLEGARVHLAHVVAALPAVEAAVDPAGPRDVGGARASARVFERHLFQAESRLGCARSDAKQVAPDLVGEVEQIQGQVDALKEKAKPLMARQPPTYTAAADHEAAAFSQDPEAIARLGTAEARECDDWNASLDEVATSGEGDEALANDSTPAAEASAAGVAVQRKQTADVAVDDDQIQATAAAGVAGANAPLPHHDTIQQAFGRHDVGQVRAQVGGDGAAAASAIGAEAYAVGDRAAFARAPDLHTAAHEAAHTVQQRAGVQLLGGVGAAGDGYEQHADRVADAVVAGRSAEPVLDEMAPAQTAGSASAGVQRLEAKEQRVGPATEFLHSNTHELQMTVARHLSNLAWPAPAARLPWRDHEGFRFALVSRLRSDVLENMTALTRLCHPGDPRAVIDEMRGGARAPLGWMPSIGLAIAQLLEASIHASLRRLGPRWLAAAEQENDSDVKYGWLVTSAPIDEIVGRAMTSGQVFDVQEAPEGATPSKALAGTRPVQLEWQGTRSPKLWNWVKAIEPVDATAEEIAATLFGSRTADAKSRSKDLKGLGRGSSLAYRITAAPPLFGLPPDLARQFSEAQEHAPDPDAGAPDHASADVMDAAWSPASAEIAMAQAPAAASTGDDPSAVAQKASPESNAIVEQTSGNLVQLNYLVRALAPWGLAGQIAPAVTFLIGKQVAVPSMTEQDRAMWQRIFAGQRDNLARIGGAIVQVLDQATALHIEDPSSPEAATLQRILTAYARAASISHLVETSQGLIEQAATQQSRLALIAVQSSARRMDASVDYDQAVSGGGEVDDPETRLGKVAERHLDPTAPDPARARSENRRENGRDAAAYDDKLQEQGIGLQSRLLAGGTVDANELEEFQLQADARALEHRAHAASVQIVALLQAAHEAAQGEGGSIASRAAQNLERSSLTRGVSPLLTLLLSSDFPKVEPRCRQMNKGLQEAVKYLGTARQNYKEKRIDADGYRQAIAKVQEKFQAIAGDEEFAKFLKDGASQVKWQVFRGACIEMAMLIGISIVGGGLAGWAAEGVGTMMATTAGVESVAELSAGARMVMGGTKMVAEAAIDAAGQTAIQGVSLGEGFLENLMISAGTSVILGDMTRAADGVAKADAEGAAMWGKAKRGKAWKAGAWVLNETLAITGHTVMGAALGYVSARLVTGQSQPPPATVQEWLMQGASVAVGRYVHKGLEGRSKAFDEFDHGYQPARDLATRTRTLQKKAKQLEGDVDKHELALEVLGEHHELLAVERQMLATLTDRGPEGDAARKQAGISMNEADAMSTDADARLLDAQAPGLAALSMHLGGLEELVPGAVWRGTREEIDAAIAHVEGTGRKVTSVRDEVTGTRRVTIDGRVMEMVERAPVADASVGRAAHSDDGGPGGRPPAGGDRATPPGDHGPSSKEGQPSTGEHLDPKWLDPMQEDAAHWQIKALDEDPRAAKFRADPEFRKWFGDWMSQPEPFNKDKSPRYPDGVPEHIRNQLDQVVDKGNIRLLADAFDLTKEIQKQFPGMPLDPTSPEWQANKKALEDAFPDTQLEAFENSVMQRRGDVGRETMDQRLDSLVDPADLDSLSRRFPGAQVYVTGSAAQQGKSAASVTDLDVVIVVPDATPPAVRREFEKMAGRTRVGRGPDAQKHGTEPFDVDAKVMTQSEFAGLAMVPTAKDRTPLSNVRVDSTQPSEQLGTGSTGIDLHNHVMGVLATDYFVDKAGGGSAVKALENAWNTVRDEKRWKKKTDSDGKEIEERTVQHAVEIELAAAYADIKNHQGQVPPEALEARARRALDKALGASEHVAFDQTYDLRDALVQDYVDPGGGSFKNFATDTVGGLADQGVTYSEQSVSLKKLANKFDEATMREVHEKLAAEGRDSDLRFLAMLPTSAVLSAEKAGGKAFTDNLETLKTVLTRGDVAGVDIAGPESNAFTKGGAENFHALLDLMGSVGTQRGRPLVLRPHVGEGYDAEHTGKHVETARHNLDMVLDALEAAGYQGPESGVIVRFGHAAHATPEQLQRMQRMGIVVEANLGSNLATSSVTTAEQHPLLYNLYYGTKTILSTDAQGVMGTNLTVEYQRAAALIEAFRAGETSLQIDGKVVRFAELDPATQNRFRVDTLVGWASEYSDQIRADDVHDAARKGP